jgi:hypothetical protein
VASPGVSQIRRSTGPNVPQCLVGQFVEAAACHVSPELSVPCRGVVLDKPFPKLGEISLRQLPDRAADFRNPGHEKSLPPVVKSSDSPICRVRLTTSAHQRPLNDLDHRGRLVQRVLAGVYASASSSYSSSTVSDK